MLAAEVRHALPLIMDHGFWFCADTAADHIPRIASNMDFMSAYDFASSCGTHGIKPMLNELSG
jgi:hypothetical protein